MLTDSSSSVATAEGVPFRHARKVGEVVRRSFQINENFTPPVDLLQSTSYLIRRLSRILTRDSWQHGAARGSTRQHGVARGSTG